MAGRAASPVGRVSQTAVSCRAPVTCHSAAAVACDDSQPPVRLDSDTTTGCGPTVAGTSSAELENHKNARRRRRADSAGTVGFGRLAGWLLGHAQSLVVVVARLLSGGASSKTSLCTSAGRGGSLSLSDDSKVYSSTTAHALPRSRQHHVSVTSTRRQLDMHDADVLLHVAYLITVTAALAVHAPLQSACVFFLSYAGI